MGTANKDGPHLQGWWQLTKMEEGPRHSQRKLWRGKDWRFLTKAAHERIAGCCEGDEGEEEESCAQEVAKLESWWL